MAVIPGNQELNLKALAAAANERKIQLVPARDLQALTGFIRGGVTALASKCDFPVYVDEAIERLEVISISAGLRGLQILIATPDYLRATNGTLAALSHPKKLNPNRPLLTRRITAVPDFLCVLRGFSLRALRLKLLTSLPQLGPLTPVFRTLAAPDPPPSANFRRHPPASSSPHTWRSSPLPGSPGPLPSANAGSSSQRYAE
jgi:hypothetical protein